jgi:hypothetical protein
MVSVSFGLTVFGDITATNLTYEETLIEALYQRFTGTPAVAAKRQQMLGKLAKFGTQPTDKGSLRHDGNIVLITGVEVESDAGQLSFSEARDRFLPTGMTFVLHTTASHTLAHERWRVLAPLAKPCPPGERAQYIDRLNGLLGGVLTRESWVPSEAFYIGRVVGVPFDCAYADTEECIDDLEELIPGALGYQPPKQKKPGDELNFKNAEEEELVEAIESAAHFFRAISELAYRWAPQGMSADDAESTITGYLDNVPVPRNDKWAKAKARLRGWIDKAYMRAAAARQTQQLKGLGRPLTFVAPAPWHEAVDGAELLDDMVTAIYRG